MEGLEREGVWWTDKNGGREVPGSLTFGVDGAALALRGFLIANLSFVDGEHDDLDIIYGRTAAGEDVTLLGASRTSATYRNTRRHDAEETYGATMVLLGAHAEDDRFSEAWVCFDNLEAWLDPPSITVEQGADVLVRRGPNELARIEVDGATIRLVSSPVGTSAEDSVTLRRVTEAHIKPSVPTSANDLVANYARPLRELLIVALGRGVRMTDMRLHPAGAEPGGASGRAFFNAVQPERGHVLTVRAARSYAARTLFTSVNPGLTLEATVANWFRVSREERSAVELLTSAYFAPFMYSEHRYSLMFQSAEALCKPPRVDSLDLPREVHRDRVGGVLDALRASSQVRLEWIAWVEQRISRNDKRLADKINLLLQATGDAGAAILAVDPGFGATAAAARTQVSHPTLSRLDAERRHWYADALSWVVRAHLMIAMGFDPDGVAASVQSSHQFKFMLGRLGDLSPSS